MYKVKHIKDAVRYVLYCMKEKEKEKEKDKE
jgi:hypothetical protein